MTDLVVTQHRFPTHATTVATLGLTYDESGQLELSEVGSGSVTLPLDTAVRVVTDGVTTNADATVTSATALFSSNDVSLPITGTGIPAGTTIASVTSATSVEMSANATASASGVTLSIGYDVRINDLLRFEIDSTVQHAIVVERITEHTLDEAGPSQQFSRPEGRGVGAVLEWGVIGPANGFGALPKESTRLFNVFAVEYDISALPTAVEIGLARIPAEWPDGDLGPYISGPSGTATEAPNGPTWLFDDFTLADDVEATVFLSADNWATGYIDGQNQLTAGGIDQGASYLRTFTTRVLLSAGTHRVTVRMFNKGPGNPSGIRYLLAETSDSGGITNVLHQSDDSWKALETPPSQPGMTPGEAVLIALDEIQDRGGLTWLSVDFDADDDSAAASWPIVADISTKTGNDLLTFLTELSATYVDWFIDPDSLTLSMWIKDSQDGPSGVTLEPAQVTDPTTGNLLLLDRVST